MERLKQMSLRRSFFLLTLCGLLAAAALAAGLWTGCKAICSQYPLGGMSISADGVMTPLPGPTPEQLHLLRTLDVIGLLGWILFPAAGLAGAGALFYRLKLKEPIALLSEGAKRIRAQDLDFTIPQPSGDELGELCAAFETMRAELLRANRELWRQTEERKRLNAAFAHDLRNPITVLKGSAKLLRQDPSDLQALERLEAYTERLGQYVEAMGSIQRLEQLPVRAAPVALSVLGAELTETARLMAPAPETVLDAPTSGMVTLDHGIFLNVAENLIGNAARFAKKKLKLTLALKDNTLLLSVADDGPGFPPSLLQNGPRPFGTSETGGTHFGMGLYTSGLLCQKHGGSLLLENRAGALAVASFPINDPS